MAESASITPLGDALRRTERPRVEDLQVLDKELEVETRRIQRDRRYAATMNIVQLARDQSGRDVFSPADAATVNLIFSLLQAVASEPVPELDKIFSGMSSDTVNPVMEAVIALCAKRKDQKGGVESHQSNEKHVSTSSLPE